MPANNEVTVAPPKVKDTSLANQIRSLIRKNPTDENWATWEQANKNVLDKFVIHSWHYYDQNTSQAEVDYNAKTHQTIEAFLTVNKIQPSKNSDFFAKEEYLLKGAGEIPNLFIQVGQFKRKQVIPTADLAHDNWLLEVATKVGNMSRSEETVEMLRQFVRNNKDKIRKLRLLFNTSNPKYLGGGADGIAFDIGDGRILKVFRDHHSYNKALEAQKRLHENPHLARTEAMIYDIGPLGELTDGDYKIPLYYYIMEKMTPLRGSGINVSTEVRNILHAVVARISRSSSKLRSLKDEISDPKKSEMIKQEVDAVAKQMATEIKREKRYDVEEIESQISNLKEDWLEKYAEEIIMKYLTGRTDLHMGNLGVTSYGYFRYFDPAYAGWESEING